MPRRIQMSRQHPWRAENPDAVIVARPSKWGNMWQVVLVECDEGTPKCWEVRRVGRRSFQHLVTKVESAEVAVSEFRVYVENGVTEEALAIRESIADLRGKDLACWCPLDQPCHADVLLELSNPEVADV